MSDYRSRQSPYEQGELKGSPERHGKKKKSKKSKKKYHQLPPEAKPYIHKAEDDDDVQIIEAAGHGEEEGGSLTIKPPQAHIPKAEKSHKHKKDKHRSKEFIGEHGRDRFYPDGKQDRHKEYDGPRDFRDAREIVRERKKERELKEKEVAREMTRREARKREESIKERERLERMELERRRERQVRDDRHVEDQESRQQKRKDDRRNLLDNKRERGRNEESHPDEHYRSRSRDQHKSKDKSRMYGSSKVPEIERGSGKKESSRPITNRHGKAAGERDDQDTRRVVVEDSDDGGDRRKSKRKDYDDDVITIEEKDVETGKMRDNKAVAEGKQDKLRREEMDGAVGVEAESEEESDSSEDSDSDSSSSGEEDSSEEEEEEEEEDPEEANRDSDRRDSDRVVDRTDDGRGKVRSKFDDHSDIDSPEHVYDDNRSDDNMLPDSPEMSEVEVDSEDDLPLYLPAIQGCRSVEEFNCLNRIEEGTYGVVYRAKDKKTNEIVALKRLKMEKEKEGFPITSLREVNTLLKSQHENIVTVREIVVGSNMDKIYIVMDFVEHDLKSLMENMKNPFLIGEVKTLLRQLLRAVRHMHDNWILHRDLKTSNLLLSHKGILKVGDFGLAREYGSPLRNYTPIVVTLWYRSPELLLGCKKYSTLVDMWSVGCIFAEMLLMKALWPGKSEIDQINRIFKDLGTPTEKIWPGVMELPGMKKVNFNDNPFNVLHNRFGTYFTECGFDLLNRFFAYDPSKRITAEDALVHDYFSESPQPVDPSMFPTWPARSEQTKKTASSPKPPSGGKAYQKLMDEEEILAASGGFHMGSAAKGGVSAQGMGFSLRF